MFTNFSYTYLFSFYIFSIFLFLSFNSSLLFWVLMEFNMLLFLMVLIYLDSPTSEKGNHSFFYFAIQSISSFIILFSFILGSYGLNFTNVNFFLFLSLVLKMGVFPLHFWVYSICSFLDFLGLSLIVTFQKVPPMMLLFSFFHMNLFIFLLISMFVGSIFICFNENINKLFVSSSIYSIMWMFLFFVCSPLIFLFYIFNYFIYCFFSLFNLSKSFYVNCVYNFYYASFFMFFMGLPPFSLFFFKFFSLFFFMGYFNLFMLLFFWLPSFLALYGYFNFFYKFFLCINLSFYWEVLNKKKFFVDLKYLFFLYIIMFFLF